MYFDKFIGIDWSGAKSSFQKGISVAECTKGNTVPQIVKPLDDKYWTRSNLIKWLYKEINLQKNLVGFDFAFSYPFYDRCCYFPGITKTHGPGRIGLPQHKKMGSDGSLLRF